MAARAREAEVAGGIRIRRPRLTTVVACLALILASTGHVFAADGPLPGTNQVGSADIINNEVESADIRDGAVRVEDIRGGSVNSGKVLDGSLTGADLQDNALTGADVQDNALTGADVQDDALTGADVNESMLVGVAQGRTFFGAQGGVGTKTEEVAGRFRVEFTCPDISGVPGSLKFTNLYADTMNLFTDTGATNPEFDAVPAGEGVTVPTNGTVLQGDRITYSWQVAGGFGTVNVDTVDRADDCHFAVQALLSN